MDGAPQTSAFTPRPPRKRTGPIRLVAVDLDGTLLTDQKQVSPTTGDALRTLAGRGVHLVLASARPPRSVRHIHQLLALDTWQINYNGALIWDQAASAPVFHRPMSPELVGQIVADARDWFDNVLMSCEILDRWYTDFHDPRHSTETARLFKPDVIAPVEEILTQPITKLLLLGEPPMISRLEVQLEATYAQRVSVVRTDANLLQIMHRGVSKAVALRKVAAHYGVPMTQVMAIGDAPNDVGMMDVSAVAVAMEHATQLVREAADWIAPSNNADGVLAALKQFEVL